MSIYLLCSYYHTASECGYIDIDLDLDVKYGTVQFHCDKRLVSEASMHLLCILSVFSLF